MPTLLKTNSELLQFTTGSKGLEIATLNPFLTNSEAEKEIVRVCGTTVYLALMAAYNATPQTMSPAQVALLPYVQKPLANLALYYYVQQSGVIISSSGITLAQDREKQAYQWQHVKLEQAIINTAYFALDALIAYLFAHKADFATWETESEYAETRRFCINKVEDYQNWVNIGSNYRTLVALRPIMRNIEATFIKNTLGTTFYEDFKDGVQDDEPNQETLDLLEGYIQPAVAHLTIARAVKELSMQITADGAFLQGIVAQSAANIAEKKAPDAEQRDQYAAIHQKEGEEWLSKTTAFLNATASLSVYPDYFESTLYTAPEDVVEGWAPEDGTSIYF